MQPNPGMAQMADDLSFLGLDAAKVAAVRSFIVKSVSQGMNEGAQQIAQQYRTTMNVYFGATVLSAAALVAIVIILLAQD